MTDNKGGATYNTPHLLCNYYFTNYLEHEEWDNVFILTQNHFLFLFIMQLYHCIISILQKIFTTL